VKQHDTSADFSVLSTATATPTAVTVTATFGGVTQRIRVIVAPANAVTLANFTITPSRVAGGASATGIVTLTSAAPSGGAAVTIEPRRRNIVIVPSTVTVPEGATSAAFAIGTEIVHGKKDKATEIAVSYNGVALTSTITVTPPTTASLQPVAKCASVALEPCLADSIVATAVTSFEKTYNLYTPELHLFAETIPSTATVPPIAYEYVWFGGQPLAQIDNTTGSISWYFDDHLGTPILQTDTDSRVVWRPEYEPYGAVFAYRRGEARHQPLRFPGQESDGSETSYNIFRWYKGGWGRYTAADPIDLDGGLNLYLYSMSNPLRLTDRLGLDTVGCDDLLGRLESPCQLECCAAHDKCFDDFNCTSGSQPWSQPKCGCDQTADCKKCNTDVTGCLNKCGGGWRNLRDDPHRRNYYCAAQHRFISIPFDFATRDAAEIACQYDHQKDCKIPLSPAKKPWWRRFFP
jgi:RHS repeat-associated protein